MHYTIQDMKYYDTNRDGEELVDKRGKKFRRVFLNFGKDAVNDKDWVDTATYLDYDKDSDNWKVGAELEGDIKKNVVGEKIFWNFYKLRPTDLLAERMQNLEERVTVIEDKLTKDKSLPF